jgi:hypothetical protein
VAAVPNVNKLLLVVVTLPFVRDNMPVTYKGISNCTPAALFIVKLLMVFAVGVVVKEPVFVPENS